MEKKLDDMVDGLAVDDPTRSSFNNIISNSPHKLPLTHLGEGMTVSILFSML
jgi:hypothetical protein